LKAVARANAVRPRPGLFRALGREDPPLTVEVRGQSYQRVDILKHDSWAATAVYQGADKKIVCKFNRQRAVFGLSLRWLGRLLARHEAGILHRLQDLSHLPRWSGPVRVAGRVLPYAVAHDYLPGHPLGRGERVCAEFFPKLLELLHQVHQRRMAYIDLHKRENILVGEDGQPYLLDFQISFVLSARWARDGGLGQALLQLLQRADEYHLQKHIAEHEGGCDRSWMSLSDTRPWFIRCHRWIGRPFRWLRRRVLVLAGVRSGKGRVESEHFAEAALRLQVRDPAA
jgi:hypothetical protein